MADVVKAWQIELRWFGHLDLDLEVTCKIFLGLNFSWIEFSFQVVTFCLVPA